MQRHSQRFPVHGFDVDAFRELSLPALAGYLQEVAGQHATELGCGIDALGARGLGWVLLRQRLEVREPIRLGDELVITTWPSGIERLTVSREFTVARADGAEVARATTAWLVLDLGSRRPVRPGEVLDRALRPRLGALAPVSARLAAPAAGAAPRRFEVRYADIDANALVHNTSVVGWALESVPADTWRAQRAVAVEAQHLAEAVLGDAVLVRAAPAGERAFAHAVARESDGKELARLATWWAPRQGKATP